MGHSWYVDALLQVGLLLLYADPARLRQELSHLLLHPGPAIMSPQCLNSFYYSPVALRMHVLYQVLSQRGGANYPVPGTIVSRKGWVLNPD